MRFNLVTCCFCLFFQLTACRSRGMFLSRSEIVSIAQQLARRFQPLADVGNGRVHASIRKTHSACPNPTPIPGGSGRASFIWQANSRCGKSRPGSTFPRVRSPAGRPVTTGPAASQGRRPIPTSPTASASPRAEYCGGESGRPWRHWSIGSTASSPTTWNSWRFACRTRKFPKEIPPSATCASLAPWCAASRN